MKITKKELIKIIKEEIQVLTEMAAASLSKVASFMGNEENVKKRYNDIDALTGKNVRPTSLKKNTLYILRERTIAHHFNYRADRFPVIFLGVGTENDRRKKWGGSGGLTFLQVNKKLKNLEDNEYYFFKAIGTKTDGSLEKAYFFGTYEYGGSLAIGSGAAKISLYDINVAKAKELNLI